MKIKPGCKNRKGTILIVALWTLVILTVFAVALGQRASLEIKLAQYQRDELKALELVRAAVERAIWEKQNDFQDEVDALNESWANNEDAFNNFALGGEGLSGNFTVSYLVDEATLYGMEDEKSKININKVGTKVREIPKQVLVNLLKECGVEDDTRADEIAAAIMDWRKTQDISADDFYDSYPRKREDFQTISELLLVRYGYDEDRIITPALLYGEDRDGDGKISGDERGLAPYITVYGDGMININTAPKKVLKALIDDTVLVDTIMSFRRGNDVIGTDDDGWFSDKDNIYNLNGEPARNLTKSYNSISSDPFTLAQWNKLQNLMMTRLSVNSMVYTVKARAEVKKVKKSLTATIKFINRGQIIYLYWYQN